MCIKLNLSAWVCDYMHPRVGAVCVFVLCVCDCFRACLPGGVSERFPSWVATCPADFSLWQRMDIWCVLLGVVHLRVCCVSNCMCCVRTPTTTTAHRYHR
eukprot:GHVQ01033176.1.p1 GENE.GHVQ01033176.1~~GHVQ01033176.1.p1  ORF type:complete len:100 (+),score=7.73 GHVQ01033176.1:93-392(+)